MHFCPSRGMISQTCNFPISRHDLLITVSSRFLKRFHSLTQQYHRGPLIVCGCIFQLHITTDPVTTGRTKVSHLDPIYSRRHFLYQVAM